MRIFLLFSVQKNNFSCNHTNQDISLLTSAISTRSTQRLITNSRTMKPTSSRYIYFFPHPCTMPSNHVPMSINSKLTKFAVPPPFQQTITLSTTQTFDEKVPTCVPLSLKLQIFENTGYRYHSCIFFRGMKTHTLSTPSWSNSSRPTLSSA